MKLFPVRMLLFVSGLLLGQPVLAQDPQTPAAETPEKKIYKQRQPDGTVTYSDQPGPGAEEVPVQQVPTYQPPKVPSFTPYEAPRDIPKQARGYSSFAITAPANDEALRENTGDIPVSVAISPGLNPGHSIEYLLDGAVVQRTQSTSIQLNNVARGTHTVTARVLDESGSVLDESTVTVHLQRTSILQPGRNPPPVPKPKPSP